jgi:hypothetical protein
MLEDKWELKRSFKIIYIKIIKFIAFTFPRFWLVHFASGKGYKGSSEFFNLSNEE